MGYIKGTIKVINEIATLGGASRLEQAQQSYNKNWQNYSQHKETYDSIKKQLELTTETIGNHITAFYGMLQRVQKYLEQPVKNSVKQNKQHQSTIDNIASFSRDLTDVTGRTFGSVTAGSIAGGSLAAGSWALVSLLGSASTGTAISGLTGVAATNATLAWFGGGSLAAGGAGMAGGTAVLGGLVALPLIYIAAKNTHKKAEELEKETAEIIEEQEKLVAMNHKLKAIASSATQKEQLIKLIYSDYKQKTSFALNKLQNNSDRFLSFPQTCKQYLADQTNIYLPVLQNAIQLNKDDIPNTLARYQRCCSGLQAYHYADDRIKHEIRKNDAESSIHLYDYNNEQRALLQGQIKEKRIKNANIMNADGTVHTQIQGQPVPDGFLVQVESNLPNNPQFLTATACFYDHENNGLTHLKHADINLKHTLLTAHIKLFYESTKKKTYNAELMVTFLGQQKSISLVLKSKPNDLRLTFKSRIRCYLLGIRNLSFCKQLDQAVRSISDEYDTATSDKLVFLDSLFVTQP